MNEKKKEGKLTLAALFMKFAQESHDCNLSQDVWLKEKKTRGYDSYQNKLALEVFEKKISCTKNKHTFHLELSCV
jgi:hypothetical protein